MALAVRAQVEATASNRALIWQVYNNSWDPITNPDGFVNIGVAENRLMHKELIERISEVPTAPEHSLTYGEGPKGSRRLRQTLSNFLSKQLHTTIPIKPEHIIITNGVSAAIEHCAWAFTNPGEAWLLGQPHYGAFRSDITGRFGAKLLTVPFGDLDPMSAEAVPCYEKALLDAQNKGVKVKALMLCNPHNPLGRCYSKAALLEYLKLCEKYQLHLVSDEVYALSIWDNEDDPKAVKFTSILSFDLQGLIDPSLVHALWGVSKDFGANGLRLGCIISQSNPSFHDSLVLSTIHSYASGLADHVVAELLEDETWTEQYGCTNQSKISDAFRRTTRFLQGHGISYAPGSNAGFFVWVNLGETYLKSHTLGDEDDLTTVIMDALWNQKVFLASGASFGSEKPGFFRITFSHPWEYLEEGLNRILKALELDQDQNSSLAHRSKGD